MNKISEFHHISFEIECLLTNITVLPQYLRINSSHIYLPPFSHATNLVFRHHSNRECHTLYLYVWLRDKLLIKMEDIGSFLDNIYSH